MDTITPPAAETAPRPLRNLTCCCCGSGTLGRQWWNRDTGYGLCDRCQSLNGVAGLLAGQEASGFGIRGIHWGISDAEKLERGWKTCRHCRTVIHPMEIFVDGRCWPCQGQPEVIHDEEGDT